MEQQIETLNQFSQGDNDTDTILETIIIGCGYMADFLGRHGILSGTYQYRKNHLCSADHFWESSD